MIYHETCKMWGGGRNEGRREARITVLASDPVDKDIKRGTF